jgi:subtilisin family serine protease
MSERARLKVLLRLTLVLPLLLLVLSVGSGPLRVVAGTMQQPPGVVPNDPLYATAQGYLADVHAPQAWTVQTGDSAIVVAVIDTGIDVSHPDLEADIWTNPAPGSHGCGDDLHGCSLLPAARTTTCPAAVPPGSGDVSPVSPHGTFVAGIIGATGNNGLGVAGVVWRVSLMAVRAVDCREGANAAPVAQAIRYATDNGARVIALSAGASRFTAAGCRAPSLVLADAVQYARDHGVLLVAPAGDDDRPCVRDPAAVNGVLAVGGAQAGAEARWRPSTGTQGSNWGPEVAVAAPAAGITSTVPLQQGKAPPNDRYATASGTAFASALVAGEAALLLSANPLLTPDWLIELITLGARPRDAGSTPNWAGAGAVDFAASFALVPVGLSGSITLDGVPAPDGTLVEAIAGGTVCAQSATFSEGGRSVYALFVPVTRLVPGCGAEGALIDLTVNGAPVAQVLWTPTAVSIDLDTASAAE